MTVADLWVTNLGCVEYREALALQERVRDARQTERIPDTLLLLEHPPIYTRGRRTGPGELPLGEDFYRERGIEIVDVDRGGRVTYHGPGQLVGYPIMRADDVVAFVRTMERAIVAALGDAGVPARVRTPEGPDYTGVWAEEAKIASIGVHVARGVTTHGFAVNVDNDMTPFEWVVPCGLEGVRMTSVAQQATVSDEPLRCFRRRMAFAFAQAHGQRQRLVSAARLRAALRDAVVSA